MIKVAVSINQSIDKVWESFTESKHIVNWNFAHPSWHCPSSMVDLKVGGEMINRMEAVDGSVGFDLKATFNIIERPFRLQYTLEDGRKVVCSLNKNQEEVELVQEFEPEVENSEDMQNQGWQAILDNFKNYTETL